MEVPFQSSSGWILKELGQPHFCSLHSFALFPGEKQKFGNGNELCPNYIGWNTATHSPHPHARFGMLGIQEKSAIATHYGLQQRRSQPSIVRCFTSKSAEIQQFELSAYFVVGLTFPKHPKLPQLCWGGSTCLPTHWAPFKPCLQNLRRTGGPRRWASFRFRCFLVSEVRWRREIRVGFLSVSCRWNCYTIPRSCALPIPLESKAPKLGKKHTKI